jgi:hypothetical protein
MKVFLAACIVAVIVALGGALVLDTVQEPVAKAFSTGSVRLSG